MCLLLFAVLMMETPDLGMFPVELTFSEIDEGSDAFLERPTTLAWHPRHGLYVVDQSAQIVFHYAADGQFLRTIGRPGQGPGEFQFGGFRPGLASFYGDELFVMSGQARRIEVFGPDGEFKRTFDSGVSSRLVVQFQVIDEECMLTLETQFTMEDDNYRVIALRDFSGNLISELHRQPFPGWSHADGVMTYHAYRPILAMAAVEGRLQVLLGDGEQSSFDVLNTVTGDRRSIDVALRKPQVTEADRDAYLAQPRFREPNMEADFPETKPFYDHILALAGGRVVLVNQDPFSGPVTGTLTDVQGQNPQPFGINLGEGGRLLAAGGQLFAIQLDSNDNYQIHKLRAP